MPRNRRPVPVVVMSVVATLVAPVAWASPLEDTTIGGAVFTGPTHAHATAMYLNPAALGLAPLGTHVYLGGSLRLDQYSIERRRIVDASGTTEPAPQVSALTTAPGGTVALYNVGSTASLGAAVGLPLNQEFIAEEEPLGYHTLGGHHRQLAWLTLAASFRVNERLLVGTGLSLTTTSLAFSFWRDTALAQGAAGLDSDCDPAAPYAPCGIENPQAAERYDVEVGSDGLLSTQNLAINAGAVYQVAQDWWVGVGYQSPAGLQAPLSLMGTVRVTPSPRDQAAGQQPFTATAEVIYRLPQTVWLGVRGPVLDGYELVVQARWQNLSRHRMFDLRIFGPDAAETTPAWYPRYVGLRDVLALDAGVETAATERLRLGGRLRFESGATGTRDLSPLQMDRRNYAAGLGAELRLLDGLTITASYGLTWFPRTTVTDSAFNPLDRLTCMESGYDLDACAAAAEGRAIPSAAGTYGRLRHAARLAVRFSFL